jgi:hypothetical protein
MPILGPIFVFLSSALAKSIFDKVFMFLALKALLTALFIIALPIVLNNVIYTFMESSMIYFNSQSGELTEYSGIFSTTGIFAWLLDCFNVPQSFSIIISAFQLHLILKMIPFSPVK